MLILISCAKIMREDEASAPSVDELSAFFSEPRFHAEAMRLAAFMSSYSKEELSLLLNINDSIAEQNYERFKVFGTAESPLYPALFSYNGIVFKNISPDTLHYDTMSYTQNHLRICSFMYGLLRPLDIIECYRLEGKFNLDKLGYKDVFTFWKSHLTDTLIADTRAAGGVLCNLASSEMKKLFDWKRVCREVEVITPEFYVKKGDKLKNIVVYTKMARGMMTRFILNNQIDDISKLKTFKGLGYKYKTTENGTMKFIISG